MLTVVIIEVTEIPCKYLALWVIVCYEVYFLKLEKCTIIFSFINSMWITGFRFGHHLESHFNNVSFIFMRICSKWHIHVTLVNNRKHCAQSIYSEADFEDLRIFATQGRHIAPMGWNLARRRDLRSHTPSSVFLLRSPPPCQISPPSVQR